MLEVRIEIVTLKLENNQRTSDLEKLAFEVTFKHPDIAKEVTELLNMLDQPAVSRINLEKNCSKMTRILRENQKECSWNTS